ncbi:SDR family NAD(P)-dependent oxidoreductase [Roseiconus lacunae]|uniref:SDR family NAD(P)-dependent oxidoreductase n=1 Tax=Roseiconus lacunae TaxID=2605694 RepID=UPI0011F379D3|nr:SDR family oxidoreductase [Roseiconus lacunae]
MTHPHRRAVVTGASSGIGQQISLHLAQQPSVAQIGIHYRNNRAGAEETAAMVRSLGKEAVLLQADFASEESCHKFVDQAWQEVAGDDGSSGSPDGPNVWINNAGADVLTGEAAGWSFDEKLRYLMRVDVTNTIAISRRVAAKMRADIKQSQRHRRSESLDSEDVSQSRNDRSMVFIGWDQAPHGMEGDAGQMFGPVKAAVMAFAASLAQELAPEIRVNTVCPGWIQTAWGDSTSEYWDRRAKDQSLMQRWGKPEDVAKAVAFCADEANTFCCGQVINVNGGWNRRY